MFFLIFALKHRLWVLVRTAHLRRFRRVLVRTALLVRLSLRVSTTYVLSKNKKNITTILLKLIIFIAVQNDNILHIRVIVTVGSMERIEILYPAAETS